MSSFSSSPSPPSSSSSSKLSPAVLFIIVILAVIFFVSGVLHLLHRFLTKHRSPTSESNRQPNMSNSNTFQRQLQYLFHLHDSGLDQAFIDALPVFRYEDIIGSKQPLDCAVCLCEFLGQDKLRLLPVCGHAFHAHCIETWLMSNSTCPLCRGTLLCPIENPVFDLEHPSEEHDMTSTRQQQQQQQQQSGVFCVRLGKYRSSNQGEAETSGSNLGARRCFSMGSYQYVVADTNLQVALYHTRNFEGKMINVRSKGESFSVSKIWQWSNKGNKFPSSSNVR